MTWEFGTSESSYTYELESKLLVSPLYIYIHIYHPLKEFRL